MSLDQSIERFDATVSSLGPIRRLVSDALARWNCDALVDDAVLCASELASNAVLHTRVPFELAIGKIHDGVRIEVTDQRPQELPALVPSTGLAADITSQGTTGRGLQIISSIAERWGVTTHAEHKVVWVELHPGGTADRTDPIVVEVEPPLTDPDRVHLTLLSLPVRTAVANGMHLDGLVREVQLGVADVEPDDVSRMYALLDDSATVRLEARRRSLQAGSLEEPRFDLELDTSYPALLAVAELYDLIGGLVSERRTGALPEGVPELRAWLHDEAARQLQGEEPRPCPLP
ncbi:MAG TPA: ATP-binding protein [Acidimicrobiales bacterium]